MYDARDIDRSQEVLERLILPAQDTSSTLQGPSRIPLSNNGPFAEVNRIFQQFNGMLGRVAEGSIVFTVHFREEENLKSFWKARSKIENELRKCFEKNKMVSDDGQKIKMRLTIKEGDYKNGIRQLREAKQQVHRVKSFPCLDDSNLYDDVPEQHTGKYWNK